TGLRASEVVSLRLTDIDRDRMLIRVEQGKGKKDRYVILSPILLEILHEWWRVARKKGWMSPGQPWLFPGYRGQHTSARQLHRIVRLAAGRAGITKRVGVHTLRHCFATRDWLKLPARAAQHDKGMPSGWATIALLCDIMIIAADHAKIGDPHVNAGL